MFVPRIFEEDRSQSFPPNLSRLAEPSNLDGIIIPNPLSSENINRLIQAAIEILSDSREEQSLPKLDLTQLVDSSAQLSPSLGKRTESHVDQQIKSFVAQNFPDIWNEPINLNES